MSAGLVAKNLMHRVSDGAGLKSTLAPVSAQFRPGGFHAVNGPSGAGKTTLLSLLSLLVAPASGGVLWNGEEITGRSAEQGATWRRRYVGLMFQHGRLMSLLTVREHIAMVSRLRARPDALEYGLALLDMLGLADKTELLPAQLSGGEKQRVALAQALCAWPAIVLADEPTAALDEANSRTVATTLSGYAREHEAVVICVTHDKVVSAKADTTLTLSKP
jgi:ABC-type lipoprotein export system ATPase subunit